MIIEQLASLAEIINETNQKLGALRTMINEASKAESVDGMPQGMLYFSPEEWEQIAMTIRHYQAFWNKYGEAPTDAEKGKVLLENATMIAYMRDMVSSWHARLEKPKPKTEA